MRGQLGGPALPEAATLPDGFQGAVERLRQEQEPWLLPWADSFVSCAMTQQSRGAPNKDAPRADARSLSERAQERP